MAPVGGVGRPRQKAERPAEECDRARRAAGLVLGGLWCWAVLRLATHPEAAGQVEGVVAAGGWSLSLLPVHCVRRAEAKSGGSGGRNRPRNRPSGCSDPLRTVKPEGRPGDPGRSGASGSCGPAGSSGASDASGSARSPG
jgi:hypothetical protein